MIALLVQFVLAALGTLGFAVMFQCPPRHYAFSALVGGLGWTVYLVALELSGLAAVACFISALVLTVLARLASVLRKTPVTVFLLAGMFPLVPGAGIYNTAYQLFAGNGGMAAQKGLETLVIAGTIALGILFGSAVPQVVFDKAARLRKRLRQTGK